MVSCYFGIYTFTVGADQAVWKAYRRIVGKGTDFICILTYTSVKVVIAFCMPIDLKCTFLLIYVFWEYTFLPLILLKLEAFSAKAVRTTVKKDWKNKKYIEERTIAKEWIKIKTERNIKDRKIGRGKHCNTLTQQQTGKEKTENTEKLEMVKGKS